MSTDEANAYEYTRKQESAEKRAESAIEAWKASKTLDILADISAGLGENELLTVDTLRVVRLDVARMANSQREQIIREWEES